MLVVYHNEVSVNWRIGDPVPALNHAGEIVVVFDPSKTNMAMLVGTPEKEILEIIEFSGNNRKRGPVMDTTLYCQEVRSFLEQYLANAKLYIVAVEQALTYKGVQYHHSNMVLTEIRSNLLNYFLEHFGIKVLEINNWSWKAGVLPEGYRKRDEKGSKRFFRERFPNSPYAYYFEADATDVICIYWYVVDTKCSNYVAYCNMVEPCNVENIHYFAPLEDVPTSNYRVVNFNPRFSLEDNLNFYVNRITGWFQMLVPLEAVSINDVYNHAANFEFKDLDCTDVKLIVRRKNVTTNMV